MSAKVFLDTNILIYAHDANERHAEKRDIARETIRELLKSRNVVIVHRFSKSLRQRYEQGGQASHQTYSPRYRPGSEPSVYRHVRR